MMFCRCNVIISTVPRVSRGNQLKSYQLLTLRPPACVLQLSVPHLWRVQVPRLPVVVEVGGDRKDRVSILRQKQKVQAAEPQPPSRGG